MSLREDCLAKYIVNLLALALPLDAQVMHKVAVLIWDSLVVNSVPPLLLNNAIKFFIFLTSRLDVST